MPQHQQVQEESWTQGNDSPLAYEPASGHHHGLLFPSTKSQLELLGESKGLITSLYADVQPGDYHQNVAMPSRATHLPPAAVVPQAGERMLPSCMVRLR